MREVQFWNIKQGYQIVFLEELEKGLTLETDDFFWNNLIINLTNQLLVSILVKEG